VKRPLAAPFIFGVEDQQLATVFCTAVGGAGLLATLLTRFESDLEPATGSVGMQPAL
jgi:hypothetical protein